MALSAVEQKALDNAGIRIGDVIDGKYLVDRVLGSGGMGIVLAATHLTLRQPVALKLLLPSSLDDDIVVARFEREARAAAMLKGEHVARVLDVGRIDNGSPYMVMELLEGSDLEQIVEDTGPIATDVAVNYLLQACAAIAEAHANGIIHRDLKPHNLFLATRVDGEPIVKILDFGISKLPDEVDKGLTGTHDVMGSPLYMAPEQLRSARDVDPRADIWALGAILFRLVTGRTPFDGDTMAQLCSRVLVDPPAPIRVLRPGIPDALARIVERCLEKEPAMRFADVAELARALAPFAALSQLSAADRVIAISTRPPPVSSSPIPPPASIPPSSMGTVRLAAHPGAFTGKSLPAMAQSSEAPPPLRPAPPPSSAGRTVAFVALALAVGAGGAWMLRGRFAPAPATAISSPPPPAVSAPPPPQVSASTPPAPTISVSASTPPVESTPPPRRRPRHPTTAIPSSTSTTPTPPPTPPDDAPDLRK